MGNGTIDGKEINDASLVRISFAKLLTMLTVGQVVSICAVFVGVFSGGVTTGRYLPNSTPIPGALTCFETPSYPLGKWAISGFDVSPAHARLAQYMTLTSNSKGVAATDEKGGKPLSIEINSDLKRLAGGAQVTTTAKDDGQPQYIATFSGTVSMTGCSVEGIFSDNRGHSGPETFIWYEPKDSYYVKK